MLGLFTRLGSLAVVIFMIFAIHFTAPKGFFWIQGGMEYSLLILLFALVFLDPRRRRLFGRQDDGEGILNAG